MISMSHFHLFLVLLHGLGDSNLLKVVEHFTQCILHACVHVCVGVDGCVCACTHASIFMHAYLHMKVNICIRMCELWGY